MGFSCAFAQTCETYPADRVDVEARRPVATVDARLASQARDTSRQGGACDGSGERQRHRPGSTIEMLLYLSVTMPPGRES